MATMHFVVNDDVVLLVHNCLFFFNSKIQAFAKCTADLCPERKELIFEYLRTVLKKLDRDCGQYTHLSLIHI